MLCDKCRQREAHIHIKQSINGITTERNLCEVCAKEERGLMSAFSMDGFFNDLFETSLLKRGSGRIGSAFEFAPHIDENEDVRHNAEFMGMSGQYEGGVDLPMIDIGPQKEQTVKQEKEDLRAQLEEAIKAENYERAAKLRDLIKKGKGTAQ
ncbi:MAG: UvrB/UvrC motif-containing protein [Christensenella sp.]